MRMRIYFVLIPLSLLCNGCYGQFLNSAQQSYLEQLMNEGNWNRAHQAFSLSEFDSAWNRGRLFVNMYGFRNPVVENDTLIYTGVPKIFQCGFGYYLSARRKFGSDSIFIASGVFHSSFSPFPFGNHAFVNQLILFDYMRTGLLPHPELIAK